MPRRAMSEPSPSGSSLLTPARVRALAESAGIAPTKKLGQNFVIDPNTVRRIVRLAGVTNDEHVIEIGPGLGSLTLGLMETDAKVTAIEIDRALAALLPETIATQRAEAGLGEGALRVIRQDALELRIDDLAGDAPEVLVANLPYNVSVPILMHVLGLLPSLQRGLVMVQSEVGERIAAGPGSKIYGAPSVKAAWYGEWQVAATISRQIFWPVPGVDSVLVSFVRRSEAFGTEALRTHTFALINAAFGGRRKMLRQSLQPVLGGAAETREVLRSAGLAGTERAESVSLEQFRSIAQASLR